MMYQYPTKRNDHFATHWRDLAEYWQLSLGARERVNIFTSILFFRQAV